jgi:hypothetical protein
VTAGQWFTAAAYLVAVGAVMLLFLRMIGRRRPEQDARAVMRMGAHSFRLSGRLPNQRERRRDARRRGRP